MPLLSQIQCDIHIALCRRLPALRDTYYSVNRVKLWAYNRIFRKRCALCFDHLGDIVDDTL